MPALEDIIDDALRLSSSFAQDDTDVTVVERSLWDKTREIVVSVKDFGATGDAGGITDDTAAFQAAIDYVRFKVENSVGQLVGGTVFIPVGRYWISNIKMKTRVGLLGASRAGTILTHYDVGGHQGPMISLFDANTNTTDVRNLMLVGAGDTGVDGINYSNNNDTNADNIFDISDPQHRITDIDIFGCTDGTGIVLNSRETHVRNVHISHCTTGMIVNSSDSWFTDISINWTEQRGLVVNGGNNTFTKVKCWFIGTDTAYLTGDAIVLDSNNNILMGCQAQDVSRYGLVLANGDENIVRGMLLDAIGNFQPEVGQGTTHVSNVNLSAVYFEGAANYNSIDFLLADRHDASVLKSMISFENGSIHNFVQVQRNPAHVTATGVQVHYDAGSTVSPTNGNVIQINGKFPNVVVSSIAASEDDAQETISGGAMNLTQTELNARSDRLIGFRFLVPDLPQGATIETARIQFKSGTASTGAVNLTIEGEDADAAAAFTTGASDITNRVKTTANVVWATPEWATAAQGDDRRTPDLSPIVQEIVDRVGFDGVLVFVVSSDAAVDIRSVQAFNHAEANHATLTVVYTA